MSDSPSVHQESNSFSVTQRLLDFLDVLRGQDITIEGIEKINKGELDIIGGLVVSRNYKANGETLEQVTIKTISGEYLTLSNNKNLQLDRPILDFFKSNYLINSPKEIAIFNLHAFEKIFRDTAKYKQYITSIFNRFSGEISVICVHSQVHYKSTGNVSRIKQNQRNNKNSVFQPYPIKIEFLGEFSANQKAVFARAAHRWSRIIQNTLPIVKVNGEEISGIVVTAIATKIDGPGNRYGQAGPTHLRPGSFLPAKGIMEFDTSDLAQLEKEGNLVNVVAHEIGHVLGLGSLWERMNLLQGVGTNDPTFIGQQAMSKYAQLIGRHAPIPVPVENIGDEGARNGHWRDSILENEVMTSFLDGNEHPISQITVAALQDMGYSVNINAADSFALPQFNQEKIGNKKIKNCEYGGCHCCSQEDYILWGDKAIVVSEIQEKF